MGLWRGCRRRAFLELEVRHRWCRHRAHELQVMQIIPNVLEHPFAAAEQRRHEMDLHLIDEARREILLGGLGAAREGDVFAASSSPPMPSGFSTLWSGPATKPSSDMEILKRRLGMEMPPVGSPR